MESSTSLDFSFRKRREFWRSFGSECYDICVIGGGITGAAVARDSALRGLRTALIEKGDFSSGTSSKSSKLVHGGFRYLAQFRIRLVREALRERALLMGLAPHLISRLTCVLPMYRDGKYGPAAIRSALWAYDFLCGSRRIGSHKMLDASKVSEMIPLLRKENLTGGGLYYDALTDDSRLVLATLQSAAAAGCHAANYAQAVGFEVSGGQARGLAVKDLASGEETVIRARVYVNATGAWSDRVRALAEPDHAPRVRPTLGIHLVAPWSKLPVECGMMLVSPIDGRPFYTIPCPAQNALLIGSTDTDYSGDFEDLRAEGRDARYLLDSFGFYFPGAGLGPDDVASAFAGLRPLVYEPGKSTGAVSREHAIFFSPENVAHIIGGKLTTHRHMASQLLRCVNRRAKLGMRPCSTDRIPLYGGESPDFEAFRRAFSDSSIGGCDRDEQARYLWSVYGSHAGDLLELVSQDTELGKPVVPGLPYIRAQIRHAVECEMAMTLSDLLTRRLHVFSLERDQGEEAALEVAEEMAGLLGWDEPEKMRQLAEYRRQVEVSRRFRREM